MKDGDLYRRYPKTKWDNDNYAAYEVFYHEDFGQTPHIRQHHFGAVCGGYTPRIEELKDMVIIGNVRTSPELLEK